MNRYRDELIRHSDLVVLSVLALVAVAVVGLELPPPVRLLPALPLIFFAPGYVLQAALFPASPWPPVERTLLAVGVSLVSTIVVGLVLAAASIPLGPVSWTVALAALTLFAAAVAWFRQSHLEATPTGFGLPPLRWRDAILITLAMVGTVAVLVGTRAIAADREVAAPEQLWLLPRDDGSLDARVGARAGGAGGAYVIRLTSAGALLEEFTVQLEPGQTWEQDVPFSEEDRRQPIVGRLYIQGEETELRFVVLQPHPDVS